LNAVRLREAMAQRRVRIQLNDATLRNLDRVWTAARKADPKVVSREKLLFYRLRLLAVKDAQTYSRLEAVRKPIPLSLGSGPFVEVEFSDLKPIEVEEGDEGLEVNLGEKLYEMLSHSLSLGEAVRRKGKQEISWKTGREALAEWLTTDLADEASKMDVAEVFDEADKDEATPALDDALERARRARLEELGGPVPVSGTGRGLRVAR